MQQVQAKAQKNYLSESDVKLRLEGTSDSHSTLPQSRANTEDRKGSLGLCAVVFWVFPRTEISQFQCTPVPVFAFLLCEMPRIRKTGNLSRLNSKPFNCEEIEKNLGLQATGRRDCPIKRHYLLLFTTFLLLRRRYLQYFRNYLGVV